MKECGSCTMCCKLTEVPELQKPVNEWCPACEIGTGCNHYETRPQSCTSFSCDWLLSEMKDDLRPDRCGVVFEKMNGEDIVLVLRAYKEQELSDRVRQIIGDIVMRGFSVAVNGKPVRIIPHKRTTAQAVFDRIQEMNKKCGGTV